MSTTKASSDSPKSLSDYLILSKQIEESRKSDHSSVPRTIKIALLTSFTSHGISEVLRVKGNELGINVKCYSANYQQYAQEILDSKSKLYAFEPRFIILFIDSRTLLGEHFLMPYLTSDQERKKWIEEELNQITSLVTELKSRCKAQILLHNFEVPTWSPLGILENKQNFGIVEAVQELNSQLRKLFKSDSQVFLFDYDAFCAQFGKRNIVDSKMYYLGDIKLKWDYLPDLANAYLAYIKPLMSINKKCIVLDLDNTLWGGTIGEDSLQGIKLGPTPEGRPFHEFQQVLLSLCKRGILLAINSKNNREEALEVFKTHPHSVLKEEHFASIQINWDDKIANLKTISRELNIGFDSLVMIDDDPFIREMIESSLPEVTVVNFPSDSSLLVQTLMDSTDFGTLQLTSEDLAKSSAVTAEKKRIELREKISGLTDYLKTLGVTISIESPNSYNIPRIAQLTQKTNQFNMTTHRYLEAEIEQLSKNPNFLILAIDAKDKFGSYGIIGVAIVEKNKSFWQIDTFLLSCRALGRNIETAMLAQIIHLAQKMKIEMLVAPFISTEKNEPANGFYAKNGFKQDVSSKKGDEIWKYNLAVPFSFPDHIQITQSITR